MVFNSKPVNFSRVLHPSAVAGCPLPPLQLNQHMQILNCSRNPKLGDDIHDMLHFPSPNSLLSWESPPSHNFYITNVFFLIMCVVCLSIYRSIALSIYRSIDHLTYLPLMKTVKLERLYFFGTYTWRHPIFFLYVAFALFNLRGSLSLFSIPSNTLLIK